MKHSKRSYLVAIVASVAFVVFQLWPSQPVEIVVEPEPQVSLTTEQAFEARRAELGLEPIPDPIQLERVERSLRSDTLLSIREVDADLADLMGLGEFGMVRERLLQLAAEAVQDGDQIRLGGVLSLLGQVAIEEQDLDTAEVYLLESLDVLQNAGDEIGSAQAYMQLGRVHLKSRQMARTAGVAYDRLLVARWQLSEYDYATAEQNLRLVIADSLSINRYGAAASAYDTLVRLHTETGAMFDAEHAAMEAARLYAASGQIYRAEQMTSELEEAGMDPWRAAQIRAEIDGNYREFKASVEQIERAKDYHRLYRHYVDKGDDERAWKLRVLAGESLAKVSKRAMYHRQPDVLAVLYVSNDAKALAQELFARARHTFESNGLENLSSHTSALQEQVF